jgi:protocatechuate 3,4-dioxygenase beta subunit
VTDPVTTKLAGYRRDHLDVDPPLLSPGYRATVKRAPKRPLIYVPHGLSEITGPVYGHDRVAEGDDDLTRHHEEEAIGQRITVAGRVLDGDGRPVPDALIEVWQANAAGRYRHQGDQHPAPLDPNFDGAGRCVTDSEGNYEFTTVQPGAYPWPNHYNAWRAAHIHFSLFGPAFATRLVTQMYFPGDPLFFQDPIYHSVRDERDRERLISSFDLESTVPAVSLGFKWDIVLRGREATPMEE